MAVDNKVALAATVGKIFKALKEDWNLPAGVSGEIICGLARRFGGNAADLEPLWDGLALELGFSNPQQFRDKICSIATTLGSLE